MTMPVFVWIAYVHKAASIMNRNTLRAAIAASVPHMEKADRAKTIQSLQESLETSGEDQRPSKEEYSAMMTAVGIGTELN